MKVLQVGYFQITGRWICYSIFFDISFIAFLTKLVKKFMKKPSFFSSNFRNPFQDVVYYRKVGCLIRILKWRTFEYKLKSRKNLSIFGTVYIRNKKILTFWIFMDQIFRQWFFISHKMIYMGLLLLKLRAVELESRNESRLLIANWYIF